MEPAASEVAAAPAMVSLNGELTASAAVEAARYTSTVSLQSRQRILNSNFYLGAMPRPNLMSRLGFRTFVVLLAMALKRAAFEANMIMEGKGVFRRRKVQLSPRQLQSRNDTRGDAKCEIPSPCVMLELVDVFQMVTVKSCAAIGWPRCGRRAPRVGTAASSTGLATD